MFFSFGQKFSTDKEKFTKELVKHIPQESFHKYVKKEFVPFLNSGISSVEFQKLVERCNYLFDNGYFAEDIIAVIHLVKDQKTNDFPSVFVTTWHNLYDEKVLDGNKRDLREFISFSESLFSEKTFFNGDNHKWSFHGGEPKWVIKKSSIQIQVNKTDLKCLVSQSGPVDSIVVKNTKGYFDLKKKRWYGRGGIVTWEKVGFPGNETFAKLRGYNVNAGGSTLKVDTVSLTTPYFEEPILGRLRDKTLFNLKEGESSPIFNSFENRLLIEGLRDQMDYDGGFSLQGAEFIGTGEPENLAKVILHFEDKPLFEVKALKFQMNPKQIIARNADVNMFHKTGDSLSTKNALVYWDESKKELRISANKKGSNLLPFVDSYFKLFIKTPLLKWTLNSAFPMFTYEVGTAQEQKYAFINSWDYFDQRAFQKFAGIGNTNPLMVIANLSIKEEKTTLPVGQVASALRKSISQCKSQLIDIASSGFIQYKSTDDEVVVEPKLLNFAKSSIGEKDYDELSFVCDLRPKVLNASITEISNDKYLQGLQFEFQKVTERRKSQPCYAFIDLNSEEIFLNEVDRVQLSAKQKTYYYPDSSYVKMSGNRNMKLSGWIESGKFNTHSIRSTFDYNSFSIEIDSSDQTYLRVNPLSSRDGKSPIAMVSEISDFQGVLYIDDSTVRSGRSRYNMEYPFVEVDKELRVLYSDANIVQGAYDSTRFYYVLAPFLLDSLDNFNESELRLDGRLVSDGIFPELPEPLRIMNDYSFGFITDAPDEGYPFYETESMYQNRIILSNNGLQGSGTINFLQATATSRKLTFLPDSAIGLAQFYSAEITDGVEYPEAQCKLAKMSFKPRLRILNIQSFRDEFITMFKDECVLDGSISISEAGMKGHGRIDLMDALLVSDAYSFKAMDIFSDSASFTLRNRFAEYGENPLAIQSDGLKSHISFNDRLGVFNSSGSKRIKFPSNKFYCQMDKFVWQMDGESIDFEKNKGTETSFESSAGIVQNNFFSLNPDQDSLQFKSISAQYDLKNETINCYRVDFLELGDAYVYPDANEVHILKNAVIDTFENARVVANRVSKLHEFTDVTLSVLGRYDFKGKGNYLYYDRDSSRTKLEVASIYFDKIQTRAAAKINEDQNFKFSNKFQYYGTMNIESKNKGVICEGYTRIIHECPFDRSWMFFEDTIIAENVKIPIPEEPLSKDKVSMAVGFLWRDASSADSINVYPAFLSSKDYPSDAYLFNSSGSLFYDYKNNRFEISNTIKDASNIYASNAITLSDAGCAIKGSGKIDLGIDLKPVEMESYGTISYDLKKKKTRLKLTAKLNIPLPKTVISTMAKQYAFSDSLNEYTFDRKTQDDLTDVFTIFGGSRSKAEKIFKEYDEDKLKKAPSYLEATFVMPNLILETYALPKNADGDALSGLRSRNSKIVLFSMGDEIVLKQVPGQVLFLKKTSPNSSSGFELILEDKLMERQTWYKYERVKRNGGLKIFTNDEIVFKSISAIKPDKRKSKNFVFTNFDEGELFQQMMLKR